MTINWQEAIDSHLKSEQHSRVHELNVFRASSLSGCLRQCVLIRQGLKEPDIFSLRHFMIGTLLHRYLQQEVSLGHINSLIEFEKHISFELDDIKFTGHIDAWDGETVYDFKSTANANLSAADISLSYIQQISIYSYALKAKKAVIVYIDKRNLNIIQKEVELIPIEEIIDFCKQVMKAEDNYKATGVLPEHCTCFGCKQEAKNSCQ